MGFGLNIGEEMRPWPLGLGPGRAQAGPTSISSSIFSPKPIQILQLPASQPLEAALAAD